jgi:YidC/Oxa1 family membrane protein insertase
MGLLTSFFYTFLSRPLFNVLIWLYNVVPGRDLGVAIIILTILIRLAFYPLSQKAIKSQKAMAEVQPKIKEIQKKYKDNKEEQAKALMDVYRQYKVNPMSGCLPILIQFPVLIALYHVFISGLNSQKLEMLYGFVQKPVALNLMFLGIISLSQRNLVLALIAGVSQYFQAKTMPQMKSSGKSGSFDFATALNRQMIYFMPLLTVFIAWTLPAALSIYWIVNNLFSIIQQLSIDKKSI